MAEREPQIVADVRAATKKLQQAKPWPYRLALPCPYAGMVVSPTLIDVLTDHCRNGAACRCRL